MEAGTVQAAHTALLDTKLSPTSLWLPISREQVRQRWVEGARPRWLPQQLSLATAEKLMCGLS